MLKSLFNNFLFAALSIPFFLIMILICVMNARDVSFAWWPFASSVDVPFYAVILGMFVFGFLMGSALSALGRKR